MSRQAFVSKVCKRGHASSALPGGRYPNGTCKECFKAHSAKWYAKNRERRKASNAKYYAENREQGKARNAKWRAKNLEQVMFNAAKARARKAGVEFTITLDDIVIPDRCPWLGIPLAHGTGRGPKDNSPTLDRIIPELGYVKGNVIVISNRANRIKNNGTPEELALVLAGLRSVYPPGRLID